MSTDKCKRAKQLQNFFSEGVYNRVLTLPDGTLLGTGKDTVSFYYKNNKFYAVNIVTSINYVDGVFRVFFHTLNIYGKYNQHDNTGNESSGVWRFNNKTGVLCASYKGVSYGEKFSGKYTGNKVGNGYEEHYYYNNEGVCTLYYNSKSTPSDN
jgi:hypothetical protein